MIRRVVSFLVCIAFISGNVPLAHAQVGPAIGGEFSINKLPVPGTMVGISRPFVPLSLKGLIVDPRNPLKFQFIVDTGSDASLRGIPAMERSQQEQVREESTRLVKYFLAGLTIPEGDLWVNLSPYEKNRMVPEALGETTLGRDLLAQDYILKQLTASMIYPEKDLGRAFWSRVYSQARKQFGTTDIPVNTFNKVWILPDEAQVYEKGKAVYITKATLKVMMDEDYLALKKNNHDILNSNRVIARSEATKQSFSTTHSLASNIIRQIILPEIQKEVNQGRNFAGVRQIYQSLILAKWYKESIQNVLFDQIYLDKKKVSGVNVDDPAVKEEIYKRYLQAYKKGAFSLIKEDLTPNGQIVPRKYFSGGLQLMPKVLTEGNSAMVTRKSIGRLGGWAAGVLLLVTFGLSNADAQINPLLAEKVPAVTNLTKVDFARMKKETELMEAAERGDLPTIQALAAQGVNINVGDRAVSLEWLTSYYSLGGLSPFNPDDDRKTIWEKDPYNDAVVRLNLDKVSTNLWTKVQIKRIVASGTDFPAAWAFYQQGLSTNGYTPIMRAAAAGHLDVVQWLLQQGVPVNQEGVFDSDPLGRLKATPLALACGKNGNVDVVEELIKNGANVNYTNWGGVSILSIAVDAPLEIVKLLVDHGANIYAADKDGQTILAAAAASKSEWKADILQYLMDKGANLKPPTGGGISPIVAAVMSSQVDAVKVLLAHGADPNTRDNFGMTLLMIAAADGDEPIVVTLLAVSGTDVNATARDGKSTALTFAILSNHLSIAGKLRAAGAKEAGGLASADRAMFNQTSNNGGIDLNQINVIRTGYKLNIQIDSDQWIELMQGGFTGFSPFITSITPITQSPLALSS